MMLDLDLFTVLIIAVCALAIAGCLLLVAWLELPGFRALALWAMSFATNAVGLALVVARGEIPDIWSVLIANALLAASYGLMWTGARRFEGRSTFVPLTLAGTLAWLVASQFDAFYTSSSARASLMFTIVVVYSLLSAFEFWRGRDDGLMLRWLIIAFLVGHALLFLIRIPFAGSLPLPIHPGEVHLNWLTFIIFETIFYAFCVSCMLASLARARVARFYRQASLTDPLTGIANRRDFLERAEALLRRTAFDQQPSAFLLFDLDEFKSINDTHGHHIGDQLLMVFSGVAQSMLRPNDILGRVGGEEFGCLIPNASLEQGREVAERIRAKFAAVVAETVIGATVSVGIAVSVGRDEELGPLMVSADRALYRAKAKGRNRVECAPLGGGASAGSAVGFTGI